MIAPPGTCFLKDVKDAIIEGHHLRLSESASCTGCAVPFAKHCVGRKKMTCASFLRRLDVRGTRFLFRGRRLASPWGCNRRACVPDNLPWECFSIFCKHK